MSEGKKERKKRRLPFFSGIKGYYCLDYYKGRTVRVVLYDQFGTPIPQSDTRYTRKNGESERDGFRFALTKAVKKVEAQWEAMADHKSEESYYTDKWKALTRAQKAQCANGLGTDDPDKIPCVKYFERNVLERLDRCGKSITQAQLLELRDELLLDTLKRVTYTQYEVKLEDVKETPVFFKLLADKLRTRNVKKAEMRVLADAEKHVQEDARLRTLLELYLQRVGAAAGVERFLELEADEAKTGRTAHLLTKNKSAAERTLDNLRLLSGNVPVAKRTVNGHVIDTNRILRGLALYQAEPFPYNGPPVKTTLEIFIVNGLPPNSDFGCLPSHRRPVQHTIAACAADCLDGVPSACYTGTPCEGLRSDPDSVAPSPGRVQQAAGARSRSADGGAVKLLWYTSSGVS